mgnify:CR=1 FL=1
MNVNCGIDIIEIDRIKESIETLEDKFTQRIYTKKEIEYCESKKNQKYQHYAARFAAKEAMFKAIANQLNDKYSISWKDIEVENDKNGKPVVKIINEEIAKKLKNIKSIDLSISHCRNYAVVNVVVLT